MAKYLWIGGSKGQHTYNGTFRVAGGYTDDASYNVGITAPWGTGDWNNGGITGNYYYNDKRNWVEVLPAGASGNHVGGSDAFLEALTIPGPGDDVILESHWWGFTGQNASHFGGGNTGMTLGARTLSGHTGASPIYPSMFGGYSGAKLDADVLGETNYSIGHLGWYSPAAYSSERVVNQPSGATSGRLKSFVVKDSYWGQLWKCNRTKLNVETGQFHQNRYDDYPLGGGPNNQSLTFPITSHGPDGYWYQLHPTEGRERFQAVEGVGGITAGFGEFGYRENRVLSTPHGGRKSGGKIENIMFKTGWCLGVPDRLRSWFKDKTPYVGLGIHAEKL